MCTNILYRLKSLLKISLLDKNSCFRIYVRYCVLKSITIVVNDGNIYSTCIVTQKDGFDKVYNHVSFFSHSFTYK